MRDRIIESFDGMSGQLQQAARYILEHPQEVALVSMRELARNAAVQPATMTRLAKFLDLKGYNEIREHYAEAVRMNAQGFAGRAKQQIVGDNLAQGMLQNLASELTRLGMPETLDRLSDTADRLFSARKIYVLGLRSCHSVAWHFFYVLSLLGDKVVHLDGSANTAGDGLMWAQKGDVLLVISVDPYVLQTIKLAKMARERELSIVSITDSEVSPLVALSDQTIIFATDNQSFFHTLTPALAISEVLCALLAAKDRSGVLAALEHADHHLSSIGTYAKTIPRRIF